MSWSFNAIGKPALIAQALEEESKRLSGQSKVEFDAAKPHLVELLNNNFATSGSGYNEPLVQFEASGSGMAKTEVSTADNGNVETVKQVQRNCSVSIKPLYGKLLI